MKAAIKLLLFDSLDLKQEALEGLERKAKELENILNIPESWEILETVCDEYLIPVNKILIRDKSEPLRTIRMIIIFICHEAGYSSENIGITVRRSRNTIDGTIRRVQELIDDREVCYDKKLHAHINKIRQKVFN